MLGQGLGQTPCDAFVHAHVNVRDAHPQHAFASGHSCSQTRACCVHSQHSRTFGVDSPVIVHGDGGVWHTHDPSICGDVAWRAPSEAPMPQAIMKPMIVHAANARTYRRW